MAPSARRAELAARSRAGGSSALATITRVVGVTPSGLLLIAFALLGLVVGRWLESAALVLVAYGLVFVIVTSWLLGRRNLAVDARRSDLPTRVREGQRVEVEVALSAHRRVSTIVLEEELRDPLGSPVRVPVPLLPRGEEVAHEYTFTPRRRGVYKVGPLVAEWSDPFGLTQRREVLAEAAEIIVHPSTELVHDRVTQREWEDPPIRPPVSKPWPTGFEFYGMRDYVSGDDPRRIIWRKTAQTLDEHGNGRYLVRESEQGITDRVNVLLDSSSSFHSPGRPSATFELAVRVAASLGTKHLDDGFSVNVDVNSERVAARLRGRGHRIRLLDALARVETEAVPLEQALGRLLIDPSRNAHNVLITPHLEQATASRLRLLLERGTSLLIVHLLWDETDPVSLHRAGGLGANVIEVSAQNPLELVFRRVVGAGRS